MKKIIKYDGNYILPNDILAESSKLRFDYIFESGLWARSASGESVSGGGSTIAYTELYRRELTKFLENYKTKAGRDIVFFDAPCGDLNWIKDILETVDYLGGDISGKLIERLKPIFPRIHLFEFDVTSDLFPVADIWHCRHCLFHLSLEDVYLAFRNFSSSTIESCLITTHFLPDKFTFDIPTGSFRFLDLTNFPFYLDQPMDWLLDSDILGGKMPMASGFWSREQILDGVRNYESNMVQLRQ